MKRWMKIAIVAIIAVPVLLFGGILVYAKVINKADETAESDFADRVEAAAESTTAPVDTTGADPGTTAADPGTTAADAATTVADAAGATPLDGTWTVDTTSEIYVGYRVEEVLSGINTTATGRTTQVTGSATISGASLEAAEFTADVASISSDRSQRDNQFRGRIMEADTFPTASFTLTQPVTLAGVPAEGEVVAASVTGDLLLHGVTRSVTFELQAFVAGGKITATGAIPILFADYDIDNPSTGFVSTEDNGLLEFLLVMAKA
ncbi:MAG: YceI family protein [Acidimicrobiia bacterium]